MTRGPLDRPELERLVDSLLSDDPDDADRSGIGQDSIPAAENTDLKHPDARGRTLGDWRLLELLGEGGMARVYKAVRRDGPFEQFGALKLIERLTPDELARFETERQVLARLSHRNIARLLDSGIDEGDGWLVMELIEGERIDRYVADRGLGLNARLELIHQVADALSAAHRQLIVHRDVKPGNVMIDADGAVKLVDFGIAKPLGPDPALTATSESVMTLRYAAPELLLGEPASIQSDVYGLGLLSYELLGGGSAFERRDMAVVSDIIAGNAPALPSMAKRNGLPFWPRLRGDLSLVISCAIAREPAKRYPNVERFASDLGAFAEQRAISVRGQSRRYLLSRFVRRNWATVGLGVILAITLVSATIYSAAQLQRANEARVDAETVAGFLQGFFDQLTPQNQNKAELTYPQLLDLAAYRLALEPIARRSKMLLWQRIASANWSIDRRQQSLAAAERARELAVLEGAPLIQRQAEAQMAMVYGVTDPDKADQMYAALLASLDDPERPRSIDEATILNDYGLYLYDKRRDSDGVAWLLAARRYFDDQPLSDDSSESELGFWRSVNDNLARVLAASDPERALSYSLDAQRICEKRFGAGDGNCHGVLANQAIIRNALGQREQAGELYRRAWRSIAKLHPPDNVSVLAAANNYALWLSDNGRADEGLALMREVLQIEQQKAAAGSGRVQIADRWQNLATMLIKNEAWDEADEALTRAAAIYQQELAPGSHVRAFPYLTQMEVALAQQRSAETLDAGERASAELAEVAPSLGWLNAVVALRSGQARRMLGECEAGAIQMSRALNQITTAAPPSQQQRFAAEYAMLTEMPCPARVGTSIPSAALQEETR